MRNCKTVREVIDVLGGVKAVQQLTGTNLKAVYYWIGVSKMFPSRLYCKINKALKKKKAKAPDWLFTMVDEEPPKKAA